MTEKIDKYDGFRFVNVYLVDRVYGGPEEGGWWFDTGRFVEAYPVRGTRAKELERLDYVKGLCDDRNEEEGNRDIGSVLSDGEYDCWIQDEPGSDFPTERPMYE
jgi:hypothetical protein